MSDENELIAVFQEEAEELLGNWESMALSYNADTDVSELNDFFRTAHTLKGSSKAVGLKEFGSFVHCVEDLIKACQVGTHKLNKDVIQVFLDAHSNMTDWLENGEKPDGCQNTENAVGRLLGQRGSSAPPAKKANEAEEKKASRGGGSNAEGKKSPSKKVEKKVVIRVDKKRIDELVNLIGELSSQLAIIEREQTLSKRANKKEQTALGYGLKYLNSLEELALSFSMQPMDGLFQRLERACKDVANATQKEITIEKIGSDVELDKTVLEKITEPLIHLVRNGVDHGVEPPDIRRRSGKNPCGHILLQATQDSGTVNLIIKDDGKGIDEAVVRKKGIEKGLIKEGEQIPRDDILKLILQPGFSTKQVVSEVSGRGVGMDVVNTALNELGGHIHIASTQGQGTCFTISLPTSIALVESIIIRDNKKVFGIPLVECTEILDLENCKTESIDDVLSLDWHEKIIAIKDLGDYFGEKKANQTDKRMAVVNKTDGQTLAFRFDEMIGRQKLFVKPLKGDFEDMFGIVGTSILPDGSASLILNLSEVARDYHSAFKEVSRG